jgi:hypothetical protein
MSSLIPYGTPLELAAGLLGPIIIRQRLIGVFVADVTVREEHDDELVVTENPVEQGAAITDHAFKQPARLTVDVGYSNSSQNSGGDSFYVNTIYTAFLALQSARIPFIVITGKRLYQDMLITHLHTVTDEATENALFLTVRMKQVILVNTQTVSVPPAANMANPADNSASQNLGTQTSQYGGGAAGGTSVAATPFNFSTAPASAGFSTGG